MTYDLAIGDRSYSSWSLRAWLLFAHFDLPVRTRLAPLRTEGFAKVLADFAPARQVPALRTPEGEVIGETVAIAETLAERHPAAGLWPSDAAARAMARYMVAEMHAGFAALRRDCPMNLAASYDGFEPSAEVRADLGRVGAIWARARARFGAGGPWLFGRYCIADAFYAPVATRIATYALTTDPAARDYVAAHLADPAFRRWRAMAQAEKSGLGGLALALPERPWPGPAPLRADLADGPSVNAACPYSGKPVTHFLKLDGRVWGFCNAFCRDKTLADAEAWPAFISMVAR